MNIQTPRGLSYLLVAHWSLRSQSYGYTNTQRAELLTCSSLVTKVSELWIHKHPEGLSYLLVAHWSLRSLRAMNIQTPRGPELLTCSSLGTKVSEL